MKNEKWKMRNGKLLFVFFTSLRASLTPHTLLERLLNSFHVSAFARQQLPFSINSPAIATYRLVFSDHAVTRNNQSHGIARAGPRDGTYRSGSLNLSRDIAV
jgi:hypothetical protein